MAFCLAAKIFNRFRIIPESSHRLIVIIMILVLPPLDHAVAIDVSEGVLTVDVVLEAHVVVEDVVEGVQTGKPRLQVFTSVAILAVVLIGALLWIPSKLVKDPVPDRIDTVLSNHCCAGTVFN